MSSLGDPRRVRAASLKESERTSEELDARPSGRVPRDLERERNSEAEFVPRTSMRVARSTARSQTARVAQLHTPEGAALESEFFWEGDQPAPERSADAAVEWEDVDSAALALRNREALAQIERRQKYQQRVLYGVTAAACFTAFGLTIELLRQKGRDVEVASAARALTETPAVEANRLVAPVVAPPVNAVVNAPLTPEMPVETVAELTVNNVADEATTAAAPANVSTPSAPLNALAVAAAPKGLAAAQPVAVSPKVAVASQPARPSLTQARPPAAALAGASFAPILGREAPASITREVRPSTPSEKPPTAAFPAVKN